jgi:membrane protease YdiL (CAAX protease family)
MSLSQNQKKIIKEVSLLWTVIFAILITLKLLSFSIGLIKEYYSLFTGILLVYLPIYVFIKKKEKIDFIDYTFSNFIKSLKPFFIFSVLTLAPLVVLVYLLPWTDFREVSFLKYLEVFFFHLIMVALPEEFFFRGYFQSRLNQVFEKKWNLFGVKVGFSLIITSIVFALSHSLITLKIWHPLIFIPALGFGWLFEKTKTITASVFYHALCNLLAYVTLFKI